MMIILIICFCILIQYNQSQQSNKLFHCTFNNGLIDDCNFHSLTAENTTDNLQISTGLDWNFTLDYPPERPLSDITSILSSTINGKMCQFPYIIKDWYMYFCQPNETLSTFTCLTASNEHDTCANGSYAYITTVGWKGILEQYRTHEIYHADITEPQCLTFYYYMTNSDRSAYIEAMYEINSTSDQYDPSIVEVLPESENKWHKSQTTFFVPSEPYKLYFNFYLDYDNSDTIPFHFAIDDISIIRGSCPQEDSITGATDASSIETSSAISADLFTDTSSKIVDTSELNETSLSATTEVQPTSVTRIIESTSITMKAKPTKTTTTTTTTTEVQPTSVTRSVESTSVTMKSKPTTTTTEVQPTSVTRSVESTPVTMKSKPTTTTTEVQPTSVTRSIESTSITTKAKPTKTTTTTTTTEVQPPAVTRSVESTSVTMKSKPTTTTTEVQPTSVTRSVESTPVTMKSKPTTTTTEVQPTSVTRSVESTPVTMKSKPTTTTTEVQPTSVTRSIESTSITTKAKPTKTTTTTTTTEVQPTSVTRSVESTPVTMKSKPTTTTTEVQPTSVTRSVESTPVTMKSKPTTTTTEVQPTSVTRSIESTSITTKAKPTKTTTTTEVQPPSVTRSVESTSMTMRAKSTTTEVQPTSVTRSIESTSITMKIISTPTTTELKPNLTITEINPLLKTLAQANTTTFATTTVDLNNFAFIDELSFTIGILTILINFIILF